MKTFLTSIFYLCVELLKAAAKFFGTTYELVNVWIFCILGPLVFIAMLTGLLVQRGAIIGYKAKGY